MNLNVDIKAEKNSRTREQKASDDFVVCPLQTAYRGGNSLYFDREPLIGFLLTTESNLGHEAQEWFPGFFLVFQPYCLRHVWVLCFLLLKWGPQAPVLGFFLYHILPK